PAPPSRTWSASWWIGDWPNTCAEMVRSRWRKRQPDLPHGPTRLRVDGEIYDADFVKVALNVVRRSGETENELPGILQRWFGANAGLPGTDFRVVLERVDDLYEMKPVNPPGEPA
ncbi:MAG TPA: hypothetical protein VEB21_07620, partial [Terriglobales bacterium]|nr:hypothetical protein [Terriglobales bacterium]